jgi:peptidoglycan/LPS O-acetylase OafA/YrhL
MSRCGTVYCPIFLEETPFEGCITGLGQFFMAGIPFAGTIVGFTFADIQLTSSRWARLIRWAAGATFTLYLLHYPLVYLLHAVLPNTWPLAGRWLGMCAFLTLSMLSGRRIIETPEGKMAPRAGAVGPNAQVYSCWSARVGVKG